MPLYSLYQIHNKNNTHPDYWEAVLLDNNKQQTTYLVMIFKFYQKYQAGIFRTFYTYIKSTGGLLSLALHSQVGTLLR